MFIIFFSELSKDELLDEKPSESVHQDHDAEHESETPIERSSVTPDEKKMQVTPIDEKQPAEENSAAEQITTRKPIEEKTLEEKMTTVKPIEKKSSEETMTTGKPIEEKPWEETIPTEKKVLTELTTVSAFTSHQPNNENVTHSIDGDKLELDGSVQLLGGQKQKPESEKNLEIEEKGTTTNEGVTQQLDTSKHSPGASVDTKTDDKPESVPPKEPINDKTLSNTENENPEIPPNEKSTEESKAETNAKHGRKMINSKEGTENDKETTNIRK